MTEQHDDITHYQVPPLVFYLLLAGSAGLGAGGMGIVGPQIQEAALRQCMDNSQTALRVAAQHGDELNELRELIYSRTADLQTRTQAESSRDDMERGAAIQNRRIQALERAVDRMEKRERERGGNE